MNLEMQGQGAKVQVPEKTNGFTGPWTPVPGPLKILMLAPTPYFSDRGCHVRIFEEAQALIKRGHQVRIVTYHLGRDLAPVPVDRILSVPWYRKQNAGPSWHKPYLDLLLLWKALRVAATFKPQIIHAHLHEGAWIGWILKLLLRLPLLFDYQGSLTGESLNHGFFKSGSFLHHIFTTIERFITRLPDFTITSSTPGLQELTGQWGVAAEKAAALPDGVNTEIFRPFPKETARQCLAKHLAPCPLPLAPIIIYLGLLNRYQGIDLLLEAAVQLVQRKVPFHLILMGFPDTPYRRMAEEMHLTDYVSFTGPVAYAEAPLLLCAGDIAVSPKISITEANGKLLNYMACGLPTVCFDTPVNRELLADTGIYADFGDPSSLADTLAATLSDRDNLHKTAEQVRQRAITHHNWDCRVMQLESSYQKSLPSWFPLLQINRP